MASVLAVDDNIDVLNSIELGLKSLNPDWNVQKANSGSEALDKCRETNFDLILLDVMMPEMDGWETLLEIKKLDHLPLVIFLTAKCDQYSRSLGEAVAADYIEKPFDIFELSSRVRTHLNITNEEKTVTVDN